MTEQGVQNQASLLFGKYSVWIFLAGLLAAIWFREVPLLVVTAFLFLLSLMIQTWKTKSLVNVKPEVEPAATRLFVGDALQVNASVANNKWLPLVWLEWEIPENKGIAWGDEVRDRYVIRFLWIMWHQKVAWTFQGLARKRGVYNAGHFVLRSGDAFRFSETEQACRLDRKLYIYPKLVPVQAPHFLHSLHWGANGRNGGMIEDPLLISGVRDYDSGDEWKRINWKASARTGKLQTNQYQPIVTKQLILFADVRGFAVRESLYEDPEKQKKYEAIMEERFESFLSVIASLAVTYNGQQIRIGFASNASDPSGRLLPYVQPVSQLPPVLDQLALMKQHAVAPVPKVLDEMFFAEKLTAPLFIFCSEMDGKLVDWVEHNKRKLPEIRIFYQKENELTGRSPCPAIRLDSLLVPEKSTGEFPERTQQL